jgi:multidrug resistance efflux pump
VDEPPTFNEVNEAPTEPDLRDYSARGRMRGFQERVRRSLLWRIALTILLLLITLLALVPAFLFFRNPHPAFATATRSDIILTVSGQGAIETTVYSASFAVPGTVAQIEIAPGQRVRKGDTLAALDTRAAKAALSDAQATLNDALSGVSEAQTAVTEAQTALSSAQTSLSTQQSYAATQCATMPNDPDACAAAQAAVARAQAQVDAAQAQVSLSQTAAARAQSIFDQAQSQLRAAQANLAATTLMAPHDGVVLSVNGQIGDQITPGNTPFITLSDTAQPLATALINYRDIAGVENGEPATVRVTQAAGEPAVSGKVAGVTLAPQGSGAQLAYPVSILIDPASLKGAHLLPGMSASVTITTRARINVVTLPVGAIAYAREAAPPSGKGLLTAAQISDAMQTAKALEQQAIAAGLDVAHDPPTPSYLIGFTNGRYVAIPVVLGLSDGQRQEIIAGLSAGQKVVSGQRNPFVE